jgi:DNA-binding NarL/FixJ family response regulator
MADKLKVVLVEDHPLVIEGIKLLLADDRDIDCIGACPDAAGLWNLLKQKQPDLILMDINLPDANGIDLCREVKEKYPAIFIVALTTNDHPAIIRKMIESGASGYVLKDASLNEITDAIKTAAKGQDVLSHSALHAIRQPVISTLPALTKREKEILELISDGLTNNEIAEKLFLNVTTIDSHRKNMLIKYNVKNTAALVKLAVSNHLIT